MPLYDYACPDDHWFESRLDYPPPAEQPCPGCGAPARRMASRFSGVILGGQHQAAYDSADMWHGTGLEGTDGVNPMYYESEKIQVDLGASRPRKDPAGPKEKLHKALGGQL